MEYPEGKGDRSINTPAADFAYYDLNNYRIENLSYLETGSEFYGNAGIEGIRSAKGLDSASLSTFKTNTYTDSAPKIAAYSDGRKIAVWLDGNSDDINAIHLYYSYFNGTAWSYPKLVQYDQTIDYAPDLVIYEDVEMCIRDRSGTEENFQKKQELWQYLKKADRKLYYKIRTGILGRTVNLPGKGGRQVSVAAYKVTQKFFGFN